MKTMLRNVLPLFALLLSAAASAAVPIQHWTAPSGARVFFVETHVLPILDVQVDFAAGSSFDPAGKSGVAALTKSLLDTGAGDLDEEKIAERVADTGAIFGGALDADRAGLALRTLSNAKERERSVELMRLMLAAPTFPQNVLEREKSRLIAGIKEMDTRPDAIAGKRFAAAVFGSHPYGSTSTVESISAIQRADLVAFHAGRYNARRATVSIVGDMSRAEAEALAQRLTEGLPQVTGPVSEDLPAVAMPAARIERIDHPASQSHILMGLPGVKRGDADYFPLLVGNYVLGGGGFVSRLVKDVRDAKGYAYSVYSYFMAMRQPGAFQIGLQTKRSQSEAALQVVNETLSNFLAKGPTEKELTAAKRNLADGFALRLDSNRKILEYLSLIGFYSLPLDYLETFTSKVEAVTVAQVRDAFQRRVKPANLVTVVVAGEKPKDAP